MQLFGRSSAAEFLGDLVVYRGLQAVDPRLPRLEELGRQAGVSCSPMPRKNEPAYARIVAGLLQAARPLAGPAAPLRHLVYVGDTRRNDGEAFLHLAEAGNWQGAAFIGAENGAPEFTSTVEERSGRPLFLANRWGALEAFDGFCRNRGWGPGPATALVLDIDKTILGARGRNDAVIDAVRLEAAARIVEGAVGALFDPLLFERSYRLLNASEFHPFTTDNQDYLAYLCLLTGSGAWDLDALLEQIRQGQLKSVPDLMEQMEERLQVEPDLMPSAARSLHVRVLARMRAGDPTPFKDFRRQEYLLTVRRMGALPDSVSPAQMLAEEIVLTQEVRTFALAWKEAGSLVFGLSDKPDEASLPSGEAERDGFLSIHRTPTHVLGGTQA